ncbi:MAG: hypothetical protein K2M12_05455 [Muribaculaceae bacterium]|nr:hypothetical protein [Muribaculaceae bacterium]
MKKLLLILTFMALVQYASAIELSFWLGNQKITPGETIKFTDIQVEEYDDWKEVTMKPNIYLMSNIYSSEVKLTATCTSGQEIQVCTNGKCRKGATVTVDDFVLQTNQKFDIGFDYIYEFDLDEEIPTVVTTIEAEETSSPGSRVYFVIEMSEKSASITEVKASEWVMGIAGGVAFRAEAPTHLLVTNILGASVCNREVSGEGTLALPQGLYVYRFGSKTGKIYVK